MITLKTNVYNDAEKRAIAHVIQKAVDDFIKRYCDVNAKCNTCQYRYICYDLTKARDYAYKIGGCRE